MQNPTHQLPKGDYGAETLRNYNYQSVYGVVLLCAAAVQKNDYTAIWCEQEDDLLAEISADQYDSYQVKTREPELGYWCTTDKGFVKSIKVFVDLDRRYPQSIRFYNFISNCSVLESDSAEKQHTCPRKLIAAAVNTTNGSPLPKSLLKGFSALSKRAKCTNDELIRVFSRLRIPPEPLRKESVIAELAANHLPLIPFCLHASAPRLRRVAVDLIDQFDEASRLSSQAPERHYACLEPAGRQNPHLTAKRVSLDDFLARCKQVTQPAFRYIPEIGKTDLSRSNPDIKRFYEKLKRGCLEAYADSLRDRSVSASAVLLDLATRPDGRSDVHHLKALVRAECQEAQLLASQKSDVFGPEMYRSILERFRQLAVSEPEKSLRQPAEVLIGIAGILTEECHVWWSNRFEIG